MKLKLSLLSLLLIISSESSFSQSDRIALSGSRTSSGDPALTAVNNLPAQNEIFYDADSSTASARPSMNISDMESDSNTHMFDGGKVIAAGDSIPGNVIVKGGDLTVFGTISGDVLVEGGDLHMKSSGKILGNVRVIDGSIFKDEGGLIGGNENRSGASRPARRESRRRIDRSIRTFDVPWHSEDIFLDKFILRYNRVESIFLGIGREKKYYWDGEYQWTGFGSIGWGIKSHTWRGNLGLARQFVLPSDEALNMIEVGVEGYSLTDTKDQWVIGQMENSLAAFLLHEDFRDYFQREGATLHTAFYTQRGYLKGELKAAYLVDKDDSRSNHVNWALFGGHKNFRINPAAEPGKMHSLLLCGGLSTMTNRFNGSEGWSIYATTEFAKNGWGSNFDFDRYVINLCRFQPIDRHMNFNIRLRAGSLVGIHPDSLKQKSFDLGGLGTMNAYPYKLESGNRMMLINAEFVVNGSILEHVDFWPTWIFQHINIILMSDAGFARTVDPKTPATRGFGEITWEDFKHDFGVAFGNRTGTFRIGVAWRTDQPEPAQFILRLNRPF